MIAKPCPECGRDDASCGCSLLGISTCRDCGAVGPTFGSFGPVDGCHRCKPSVEFVPLEDTPGGDL